MARLVGGWWWWVSVCHRRSAAGRPRLWLWQYAVGNLNLRSQSEKEKLHDRKEPSGLLYFFAVDRYGSALVLFPV